VKRKAYVTAKNNIPVHVSKILPTTSPFYGVNPSAMCCRYSEKKKVSIYHDLHFDAITGGEQSVAL
jgi:hypothetical protein